jgi:hypothetical protein
MCTINASPKLHTLHDNEDYEDDNEDSNPRLGANDLDDNPDSDALTPWHTTNGLRATMWCKPLVTTVALARPLDGHSIAGAHLDLSTFMP